MSTINMCDRCETMMTSNAIGQVQFNPNREMGARYYDLCPACVTELVEFFAVDSSTLKRPRAFRNPYVAPKEIENADENSVSDPFSDQ